MNKGRNVIDLKTQLINFSKLLDAIPLLDNLPTLVASLSLCVYYWMDGQMDGWMVDKDPHAFKLNFGTQSLISDKPQPPPLSHSHHALAKLNPAFGDQDPRVSRPLHM